MADAVKCGLDIDEGEPQEGHFQFKDVAADIDLGEHDFPLGNFHILDLIAAFALDLVLLDKDAVDESFPEDETDLARDFLQGLRVVLRLELEAETFQLEELAPFLDVVDVADYFLLAVLLEEVAVERVLPDGLGSADLQVLVDNRDEVVADQFVHLLNHVQLLRFVVP